MPVSPDQLLAEILHQHQAKSILLIGNTTLPALQQYLSANTGVTQYCRPTLDSTDLTDFPDRFDLCLITDDLNKLDKAKGTELIGGIRNRLCHHIYLFLPLAQQAATDQWQVGDLFALGLKRVAEFKRPIDANDGETENPTAVLSCFAYQIENYIKKRDWNNARYWANPENFGKYWW